MMDAVHRVEGTVNQVLGDGIMALFRAPLAHEDHALRACYAALAMQTAIREYTETVRRTHGIEMRIRVGLNAGEVVVRAIGNDLHMDYAVRSADIVLLFSGGIGTLNEFTIAYDEGKIIGLLQGTGGVADLAQMLLDTRPVRSTGAVVIADPNPEQLVDRSNAQGSWYIARSTI
jgi:hypothetical protein